MILSDLRITFVNHIDRCIPLLPDKLTPNHSCYHTVDSTMNTFLDHLRKKEQVTLDQLKHFFDLNLFEKLKQIVNILSDEDMNIFIVRITTISKYSIIQIFENLFQLYFQISLNIICKKLIKVVTIVDN